MNAPPSWPTVAVTRTGHPGRTGFALNRKRPEAEWLHAIFDAAALARAALSRPQVQKRALALLPMLNGAGRLIRNARAMRHVS